MFYKYKWLELAYPLAGHAVLITWVVVLGLHIGALDVEQRQAVFLGMGSMVWVFVAGVIALGLVFLYALLCSAAVVLMHLKLYRQAERVYRLTLQIRRGLPVVGGSARGEFWNVSLANCLREQRRYEEAEEFYVSAIGSCRTGLDSITHCGLREVAMENYAELLRRTGREGEAQALLSGMGKGAVVMQLKYALVTLMVVTGGAWFAVWEDAQLAVSFGQVRNYSLENGR